MITFESIKEKYNALTDKQKELLSDVSVNVFSNDLNAYIKAVKSYDDNNAVINYLEYARDYDFPDVYYLSDDDGYDDQVISIDDFNRCSLFDYIDNETRIESLKDDFINFVIDPVRNNEPDLTQYNDQYFKDEAEAFIKEHNENIK